MREALYPHFSNPILFIQDRVIFLARTVGYLKVPLLLLDVVAVNGALSM